MINGIRQGHESAFAQLFESYYRPLSIFASRFVSDLETAKEIVQDFFVHLFENCQTLVITTSLESYLYQSVRNRCLNHIQSQKVRKKHLDQYGKEMPSTEDLESLIRETELEHQIFQIISNLPPQCQKIFRLSRVKGLRNQEIAEILKISVRTVETQVSKALKILRKGLGDQLNL